MGPHLEDHSRHQHPHAFINKAKAPIIIKGLDEEGQKQLVEMYLAFQPRASFNGLPPITDEACAEWVRGMVANGTHLVAMAFDRGIVGHAGLFPMDSDTCETLTVVLPRYQNVGIGTQLMRCAIQSSHELGFKRMWLCVEARNLRARHVYSKCGFDHLTSDDYEVEMALDLKQYYTSGTTTVGEVMNQHVTTVFRDWPCRAALDMFLDNPVGALPVVNDRCEVIGILSQTDLIVPANIEKTIGEVLTKAVITVREDCPLARAVRTFRSRKVRCIPVVDTDRKLVGILTRKDILAYYAR